MKISGKLFASVLMIATTSPAFSWGGDISQNREIYRDTISVKMADGKVGHAVLVFNVSAVAYVGQDGNARWPDDRACYYNSIRRTLVRQLTLTTPDGTEVPVRDTTVALPEVSGYHWGKVNTCNDKISDINSRILSAIGNASTWQTYIDGDRSNVNKILSQFGQVM